MRIPARPDLPFEALQLQIYVQALVLPLGPVPVCFAIRTLRNTLYNLPHSLRLKGLVGRILREDDPAPGTLAWAFADVRQAEVANEVLVGTSEVHVTVITDVTKAQIAQLLQAQTVQIAQLLQAQKVHGMAS